MYQYNRNGKRWYYANGQWYASVTTFVKQSLPTPPHLIKWYQDNTAESISQTLKETSEYGTQLHAIAEDLLRDGSIDLSGVEDETLLKHVLGLAQFFADWEVKPISIEERLHFNATPDFPVNIAGTVDLIANTNKGISIIDFKSGNIYDHHKYQMMCYALGYGNTKVNFVNVRPKEWRTKPTYEAKVWKVEDRDWRILQAMAQIFEFDPPKPRLEAGIINLSEEPTYNLIDPEQWINQQIKEVDFVI